MYDLDTDGQAMTRVTAIGINTIVQSVANIAGIEWNAANRNEITEEIFRQQNGGSFQFPTVGWYCANRVERIDQLAFGRKLMPLLSVCT